MDSFIDVNKLWEWCVGFKRYVGSGSFLGGFQLFFVGVGENANFDRESDLCEIRLKKETKTYVYTPEKKKSFSGVEVVSIGWSKLVKFAEITWFSFHFSIPRINYNFCVPKLTKFTEKIADLRNWYLSCESQLGGNRVLIWGGTSSVDEGMRRPCVKI